MSAPGQGMGGAGPILVCAAPSRPAPTGPSSLAALHVWAGRQAASEGSHFTERMLMSEGSNGNQAAFLGAWDWGGGWERVPRRWESRTLASTCLAPSASSAPWTTEPGPRSSLG